MAHATERASVTVERMEGQVNVVSARGNIVLKSIKSPQLSARAHDGDIIGDSLTVRHT
jgi:hypothetical protein